MDYQKIKDFLRDFAEAMAWACIGIVFLVSAATLFIAINSYYLTH
jgi:hypothetical protein